MSKFKVGDCVVVDGAVFFKNWNGVIGVVVGFGMDGDREVVVVDPQPSEFEIGWYSHCLRKINPPSEYDGNKTGDWDLCPWQPKKVTNKPDEARA